MQPMDRCEHREVEYLNRSISSNFYYRCLSCNKLGEGSRRDYIYDRLQQPSEPHGQVSCVCKEEIKYGLRNIHRCNRYNVWHDFALVGRIIMKKCKCCGLPMDECKARKEIKNTLPELF